MLCHLGAGMPGLPQSPPGAGFGAWLHKQPLAQGDLYSHTSYTGSKAATIPRVLLVMLSCCWTQAPVSQGLSHPLVAVCGCETKECVALVFQFNTGLPLKTLVICWGPYCLLCFYAAVENVMFISPKYRMVCLCHLREFKWHFSHFLLSTPRKQY